MYNYPIRRHKGCYYYFVLHLSARIVIADALLIKFIDIYFYKLNMSFI